jgi:hypothetical protein
LNLFFAGQLAAKRLKSMAQDGHVVIRPAYWVRRGGYQQD